MTHNTCDDPAAADWDLFGEYLLSAGQFAPEASPGGRWHLALSLFRQYTGREPRFDAEAAWRDCSPRRVPFDAFIPERVDICQPPSEEVG